MFDVGNYDFKILLMLLYDSILVNSDCDIIFNSNVVLYLVHKGLVDKYLDLREISWQQILVDSLSSFIYFSCDFSCKYLLLFIYVYLPFIVPSIKF